MCIQYYSNIPRSIMLAVPLVTAVYFMMNISYMTVLTIPEMIAAPAVAVVIITIDINSIWYTQKTLLQVYKSDLTGIHFQWQFMYEVKYSISACSYSGVLHLSFCHKMSVKIIHSLLACLNNSMFVFLYFCSSFSHI